MVLLASGQPPLMMLPNVKRMMWEGHNTAMLERVAIIDIGRAPAWPRPRIEHSRPPPGFECASKVLPPPYCVRPVVFPNGGVTPTVPSSPYYVRPVVFPNGGVTPTVPSPPYYVNPSVRPVVFPNGGVIPSVPSPSYYVNPSVRPVVFPNGGVIPSVPSPPYYVNPSVRPVVFPNGGVIPSVPSPPHYVNPSVRPVVFPNGGVLPTFPSYPPAQPMSINPDICGLNRKRNMPSRPRLSIDPNIHGFRSRFRRTKNPPSGPMLRIDPNVYGGRSTPYTRRTPHRSCNPRGCPLRQYMEKLSAPTRHVFKLNPYAKEFISSADRHIDFQFNPNAEEFIPGGIRFTDNPCPDNEAQTTQGPSFITGDNASRVTTSDESGVECEDSEDSEGDPLATLDSSSEVQPPGFHDGESTLDCGIELCEYDPEAEPFMPRYWNDVLDNEKYDTDASRGTVTSSHQVDNAGPQQFPEEEPKHHPQVQFLPNSAAVDLKGDLISFYMVDTSQTMQFPGLDASTLSIISSGPSKSGIPVLVTPEIQSIASSFSKLPEPLRVVHPTLETPYTRVYALGGFELASPFPPTPKAIPTLSIEAYLALNQRQQQGYKPSYGFIGFGTGSLLAPPSPSDKLDVASEISTSVEDEDGDLPSYDLIYGLVGYVPVPNQLCQEH